MTVSRQLPVEPGICVWSFCFNRGKETNSCGTEEQSTWMREESVQQVCKSEHISLKVCGRALCVILTARLSVETTVTCLQSATLTTVLSIFAPPPKKATNDTEADTVYDV